MNVAIFSTKPTVTGVELCRSMMTGVAKCGDAPTMISHPNDLRLLPYIDVGVQICFPSKHTNNRTSTGRFRSAITRQMRALDRRTLYIDTGFIKEQHSYFLSYLKKNPHEAGQFDRQQPRILKEIGGDVYYQVGYDGVKYQAQYYLDKLGYDSKRWDALNQKLHPWHTNGKYVLLLGQTLHGAGSDEVNIYTWYRRQLLDLRKHTKMPVVIRSHPRQGTIAKRKSHKEGERRRIKHAVAGIKDVTVSTEIVLEDDLAEAHAAIAYSTNAAVTAIIHGVPVFRSHQKGMVYPLSEQNFAKIENPPHPDRLDWAHRLAYCQWTMKEIKSGEVWKRMRRFARKKKK